MDKKLKAKWVKALRSGEYKQCRGDWRIRDAYCCIGVLLDLTGNDFSAPRHQALALGLSPEPEHSPRSLQRLINMNDYGTKSFAEIADHIEEHL